MTSLPGLHVVTDDEVLAAPWFPTRARDLLEHHGSGIALHLRGPRTSAARLLELAEALASSATAGGALLLVNDRADVALAAAVHGVHAGRRSLPPDALRTFAHDWVIGASAHSVGEAAEARGADFILAGTIWSSGSHPGRAGVGLELVRQLVAAADVPVYAIGGVTPERAVSARAAGAAGVAVLSGVWSEDAPARAAERYLEAMTSGSAAEG